ncbi:hypothetical protein [Flavisolibacter tropicus]|uniref:Uncharacterized protein n=1 Tax=Flavisolibacter tropicus TaxID=1492898 RepID=A0A172TY02_9BACT|nr:hypothetical protein [Flavisolibacter tropicus]ANE51653.1 hypothetical protein SY85_15235 [Flavisolibacter tropicus]
MFAVAVIAGFIAPFKPWRWGIFVVLLQPYALFIQYQAGPFIIVSLFFFVFMAVAIGCAYIGKVLRSHVKQ